MQFKNYQNTYIITSNPTTLDDMGGGFVSARISNDDRRMCGSMQCGMTMPTMTLAEEWTGQEGVKPQDSVNRFDLFSGFLYPGGRFAFTNESVHYHHRSGFAYLMDIAATAVLNRCPSKKIFPDLFLHLAVSFSHGFMYFPSQTQHPPFMQRRAVWYGDADIYISEGVLDGTGGGGATRRSKQI
jgi:hypothetical protein